MRAAADLVVMGISSTAAPKATGVNTASSKAAAARRHACLFIDLPPVPDVSAREKAGRVARDYFKRL
jgi:hypothetical protein